MWDSGRELIAEAVGTAFLLAAVVGSGIMAERLTDDAGLALLIAAVVTGLVLAVMIAIFIDVSGAHFNPAVTLAAWRLVGFPARLIPGYVGAQVVGGFLGVVAANLMFELDAVSIASTDRWGTGAAIGEVVATLGLVLLIFMLVRQDWIRAIPAGVGAYIAGAYFFTSSTSFANPAVTVARIFSDTPAGIAGTSAPGFVLMQLVGALLAVGLVQVIATPAPSDTPQD
jgi:glycerol uptake facilitator-like aquaporin